MENASLSRDTKVIVHRVGDVSSDEDSEDDEPSEWQPQLTDQAQATQQIMQRTNEVDCQRRHKIAIDNDDIILDQEQVKEELKVITDTPIATTTSKMADTIDGNEDLNLALTDNKPTDPSGVQPKVTWRLPFASEVFLDTLFSWYDKEIQDEILKTFVFWPVPFLRPRDLTKSGFYYLGRGDAVRCVFCKIEILNWKEGDDPEVLHKRDSPECPLMLSDRTLNVPESISDLVDNRDECGVRAPGPVNPSYASESSRLRTFKDWPKSLRQKPEKLAEAGFFYTGQSDMIKCFYCDGALNDWEGDSVPWKEHATWFDSCAFVQLMMGRDYVQKVKSEHANDGFTYEPDPPTTTRSSEQTASTSVEDFKLCKICFVEERNVCFVPCGHVVACEKCTLASNKCAVCRRTFTNAVRLYFA